MVPSTVQIFLSAKRKKSGVFYAKGQTGCWLLVAGWQTRRSNIGSNRWKRAAIQTLRDCWTRQGSRLEARVVGRGDTGCWQLVARRTRRRRRGRGTTRPNRTISGQKTRIFYNKGAKTQTGDKLLKLENRTKPRFKTHIFFTTP